MEVTLAGSSVTDALAGARLLQVSLEFAAFDGEVGVGQLPIPDSDAALAIATGRQAMVEEGSTLLTDGFMIDQDRTRSRARGEPDFGVSVMDANALLDGFRVVRNRPAETDYARVAAFAAVDGPGWDTTWVLNSATVTLPAKQYRSDGGWSELIADLVAFTGKTLFLHDKASGGRCLHYHVLTTGHTSGLEISDVTGAADGATIWAPWAPSRKRTSVDLRNDVRGRDQDGRVANFSDAASIAAHNADGLKHQSLFSFEAKSQADLEKQTQAFLASQKGDRDTYTCAIGPLDEDALALIRVGDLIPVTSSVMGLTASNQRIAHMTLTPVTPYSWVAHLELGAPIRRRARVKSPVIAIPPAPYIPGELGLDDGTFLENFNHDSLTGWDTGLSDSGHQWSATGGPIEDGHGVTGGTTPQSGSGADTDTTNVAGFEDGLFRLEVDFVFAENPDAMAQFGVDPDEDFVLYIELHDVSNNLPSQIRFLVSNTDYQLWIAGSTTFVQPHGLGLAAGSFYTAVWTVNASENLVTLDIGGAHFELSGSIPGSTPRILHAFKGGSQGSLLYFERIEQFNLSGVAPPSTGQSIVDEAVGTGDGSTTTFNTSFPWRPGAVVVKINGIDVTSSVASFDAATGEIVFSTPPAAGADITVDYMAA